MEAGTRAAAAALLERDRELARLAGAFAGASEGVGSVVALEGDPGIGKTALLAHAHHVARDAGMRVLRACGGELERDFAYGVVRQLLEAPLASARPADRERWLAGAAGLAAPVVMASAVIHPTGPDPGPILHGLYWLTANLSTERPLLIAVDDAHWADPASIAFMSYLARRVDELGVVILYACRVGEHANHELPTVAEPANVAACCVCEASAKARRRSSLRGLLGAPAHRTSRRRVTSRRRQPIHAQRAAARPRRGRDHARGCERKTRGADRADIDRSGNDRAVTTPRRGDHRARIRRCGPRHERRASSRRHACRPRGRQRNGGCRRPDRCCDPA